MRCVSLLVAVLFVVPLLGSDSPREYDDATEIVGIQGVWRQTAIEFGGRKIDLPSQNVTTFRGGPYPFKYSDGDTERGSYCIDPTRKPLHLDWMPSSGPYKGKTIRFIYQIDGDILRIAGTGGENYARRPQGFSDHGIEVNIFKRVK